MRRLPAELSRPSRYRAMGVRGPGASGRPSEGGRSAPRRDRERAPGILRQDHARRGRPRAATRKHDPHRPEHRAGGHSDSWLRLHAGRGVEDRRGHARPGWRASHLVPSGRGPINEGRGRRSLLDLGRRAGRPGVSRGRDLGELLLVPGAYPAGLRGGWPALGPAPRRSTGAEPRGDRPSLPELRQLPSAPWRPSTVRCTAWTSATDAGRR